MESRSGNKPLTRAQMALLPYGFTATNQNVFGMTGQQIKKLSRQRPWPSTNRKRTPGRRLQIAPVWWRDEFGNLPVNEAGEKQYILMGHRQIWHKH